jgi:UTP--glucose-1-phosphate uridylyltransferase
METAVITAAGEGSRLLPLTRGMRKEFLPLCSRSVNGGITLKPLLNLIFEQLYSVGIRRFCFVLRKGESTWKNYLKLNDEYINRIKEKGKSYEDIDRLKKMIDDSEISFAYQPTPKGFGDAVAKAERFVKDEDFIVHAGDGYLLGGEEVLRNLIKIHSNAKPAATLISREVKDATRYGVVNGVEKEAVGERVLDVSDIVEKSPNPPSNKALLAVYAFNSAIFGELHSNSPNERTKELELTDGVKSLLTSGSKIYAIHLNQERNQWLSVGSIDGYLKAFDAARLNPP